MREKERNMPRVKTRQPPNSHEDSRKVRYTDIKGEKQAKMKKDENNSYAKVKLSKLIVRFPVMMWELVGSPLKKSLLQGTTENISYLCNLLHNNYN